MNRPIIRPSVENPASSQNHFRYGFSKRGLQKLAFVAAISFLGILMACTKPVKEQKKGDTIFVSILPQKYMVEQIAGKSFNVNVLLPPGASPATYEPSPAQLRGLTSAKAYIRIGKIGFEQAWMNKLTSTNSEMKVFDQSEGVKFIKANHSHGNHQHHIYDPHIWLSPAEVITQGNNIFEALSQLKPDSTQFFKENLEKFKATVTQVDKKLLQLFENTKKRTFMVYHPSLSYLARDYQLQQIALEKEGKEPSGQYMTKLIDTSRKLGLRTIFIQKQFPRDKANALARELDAEVEVIDPLAPNWPKNMVLMAKKIQTALNN